MENMTIKDAAKKLGVEAHVLRYWEDELCLEIKRNSMGHRYYDERDIQLFNKVKELKENGLALKDIRIAIMRQKKQLGTDNNEEREENSGQIISENKDETLAITENKNTEQKRKDGTYKDEDLKVVDFKQAQLQAVMNKVMANALRENKDIITSSIKEEITADVMRQFDTVMREKEEKEEARFKKIDEYLRQLQQANSEVAATKSNRFFRRRK